MQSAFATDMLVHERNTIKIASDLPLEVMAPFGCGVQTGAGAVLNTLKVQIVCKFINMLKSNQDDAECRRLIEIVRQSSGF